MAIRVFSDIGPFSNNVYLVWDEVSKETMVVDTSLGSERVWDVIQQEGLTLSCILNTHGHLDHLINNAYFKGKAPGAGLILHKDDLFLLEGMVEDAKRWGVNVTPSPAPDRFIEGGQQITLGETHFQVLHTPGHSPGSVSVYGEGWVIAGDTLFQGAIGRCDLPGGDMPQLLTSIREQLLTLPQDTTVYPGHGAKTTIGDELVDNPYLQESFLKRVGLA